MPRLRVVKHDRPAQLDLHPEIEREWTSERYVRAGIAVVCSALGLIATWAIASVLGMWWGR